MCSPRTFSKNSQRARVGEGWRKKKKKKRRSGSFCLGGAMMKVYGRTDKINLVKKCCRGEEPSLRPPPPLMSDFPQIKKFSCINTGTQAGLNENTRTVVSWKCPLPSIQCIPDLNTCPVLIGWLSPCRRVSGVNLPWFQTAFIRLFLPKVLFFFPYSR